MKLKTLFDYKDFDLDKTIENLAFGIEGFPHLKAVINTINAMLREFDKEKIYQNFVFAIILEEGIATPFGILGFGITIKGNEKNKAILIRWVLKFDDIENMHHDEVVRFIEGWVTSNINEYINRLDEVLKAANQNKELENDPN